VIIDDVLSLSRRIGTPVAALILVLWLVGWSVGCVVLIENLVESPTLEMAFFATPFLSFWVAAFAGMIYLFFGVETLRIGPDGIHYLVSAMIPLRRRSIPLDELTGITLFTQNSTNSGSGLLRTTSRLYLEVAAARSASRPYPAAAWRASFRSRSCSSSTALSIQRSL
jgi:hypothetical protein